MAIVPNKANNGTPVDQSLALREVSRTVIVTQAEYDALAVKDPSILYVIVG